MIFENKHNYPQYVYDFLKFDEYDGDPNTISATTLLSPPRQFALKKVFHDKLRIDVSDLIASRYGTCIHAGFEKVPMENIDKEVRLFADVEVNGETKRISGQFDMIKDTDKEVQTLVDIKSTSVWSYIYSSKDEDYKKQLSIYRFLANQSGYNISDTAEICMVFTDWSKARSKSSKNYPDSRIMIKKVELMSIEDTEKYIIERLKLFSDATKKLPLCSKEDLWMSEGGWEVKIKNKTIKLAETKEEALDYLKWKKYAKYCKINHKQPVVRRCNYCVVRDYCEQYKEMDAKGLIAE